MWTREALIKKQEVIKDLLNRMTPDTYGEILQKILAAGYETEETLVSLADQVRFWRWFAVQCLCLQCALVMRSNSLGR